MYCSFPSIPEKSLGCVSVNLKHFEMGSVYSEAKGRLLRHDTSAGGSLKANLEDISTKFLLEDIIVHDSCFFPPEPGNKVSPCSVSGLCLVFQKFCKTNILIAILKY